MTSVKNLTLIKQGAEAKIYEGSFLGKAAIFKLRFPKTYRHPKLEESLTKERVRAEARALLKCRLEGIHAPAVYYVDLQTNCIVLEFVQNAKTVREYVEQLQIGESRDEGILTALMKNIGSTVAHLHRINLVHGDLTTSNMLVKADLTVMLIDFGLSYVKPSFEDKGVDLYVLEKAFLSTHPNTEHLFQMILQGYRQSPGTTVEVLKKLDAVRLRGRKRTMVG